MKNILAAPLFVLGLSLAGLFLPSSAAATGIVDNSYNPTQLPFPLPHTVGGVTYHHAVVWPHSGANDHWVAYYNGSLDDDPMDDWLSSPTMILLSVSNVCYYQSAPGGGGSPASCGAIGMYSNDCTKTYFSDVDVRAGGNGTLWSPGPGCPSNIAYSANDVLIGGNPYTVTTSLISPMSGFAGRTTSLAHGATWTYGECPGGTYKKHSGRDVTATSGEDVFAAHGGVVKAIFTGDHATWADAIIIEDLSGTFTTVYWHVGAYGGLAVNDTVTPGQKIATVANLGGNTHFHFGIRSGAYNAVHSLAGALPVANCSPWTAFPENTVNPANYTYN